MNKEEQKKLLTEIMDADAKDGLYHIGDNNKMVTAVEWLRSKLLIKDSELENLFEQAKAMEKEQIMMAFNDGKVNFVLNKRNSERYYNETYNK